MNSTSYRTPSLSSIKGALIAMILFFTIGFSATAQDKKAQEMFDQQHYSEVIDHYTKNFKKGLSSADVRLMTKSMLQVGLTEDALELAQKSYMEHTNDTELLLGLVEALIFNGQYSSAYYLLEEYSDMEFQSEEFYELATKAAILNQWEKRERDYDVVALNEFNTARNEFSLFVRDGKRIFCSSQQKEEGRSDKYDKARKEFTSLYEAKSDTTIHKPYAKGIFKGKFNVGPFDFNGDKIYFTFSEEATAGINRLQIMCTNVDNPSLANAEPLDIVDSEYSFAHPAFSADGSRMIFASDMPGGEGGMDLYYSLKTANGWSNPISLGDVVNTPGNEVFPRIVDNYIYFSSDGHPGYGGLDIYMVSDDRFREDLMNLYAPINSPYDDFAYLRTGEFSGYFSSNRPGGKGGDDIFRYDKRKVMPDMRLISGILEIEGKPRDNVKVLLTDGDGNIIEQAFTDVNGVFYFNRDPEGGEFNIRIDDENEDALTQTDLYLTDEKGQKGQKIRADKDGNFVFELLALDDYFVDYMEVDDNSLFVIKLRGQMFYEKPGDLDEDMIISLMNERGIITKETESAELGYFVFSEIVPVDRYYFRSSVIKEGLRMAMLDDHAHIIEVLKQDENGWFYYDRPYNEEDFISLYNEDNQLISVEKDGAINLPDILYDRGSWELKPSAKEELNKLIGILKNNEALKIELSSHTDSRGSARFNADLSTKRAHEALGYIVSHGVDPSRIQAIGKGEDLPVNSCIDGVECNEDEHALNRRTEFRIISN